MWSCMNPAKVYFVLQRCCSHYLHQVWTHIGKHDLHENSFQMLAWFIVSHLKFDILYITQTSTLKVQHNWYVFVKLLLIMLSKKGTDSATVYISNFSPGWSEAHWKEKTWCLHNNPSLDSRLLESSTVTISKTTIPPFSLESEGLLVGMMQYFLAKGSALEVNFCCLPEKYCIVMTSSPWVSEDVSPFKWMINLLKNLSKNHLSKKIYVS